VNHLRVQVVKTDRTDLVCIACGGFGASAPMLAIVRAAGRRGARRRAPQMRAPDQGQASSEHGTTGRTKGFPPVIFEGTARDLVRLDALCLECWRAVTRVGNPIGVSRVQSAARTHPWPGDPDEIAALLASRGFRCRLDLAAARMPSGEAVETIVTVLGVA
jgi:hypothetical protein